MPTIHPDDSHQEPHVVEGQFVDGPVDKSWVVDTKASVISSPADGISIQIPWSERHNYEKHVADLTRELGKKSA